MGIGTSLGAYFNTEMEMYNHYSGSDNNVLVPETMPDLNSEDRNELPPQEIPSQPKLAPLVNVSDIEDRRDWSEYQTLVQTLKENLSEQKFKDVMAHPLMLPANRGMAVNADDYFRQHPEDKDKPIKDIGNLGD